MIDDYMLDKVFDGIKEIIGIKKFDNTKILIYTDDKLPWTILLLKCCDINNISYKR